MNFRHIGVGGVFNASDCFSLEKLPFLNEFKNAFRVGPRDTR